MILPPTSFAAIGGPFGSGFLGAGSGLGAALVSGFFGAAAAPALASGFFAGSGAFAAVDDGAPGIIENVSSAPSCCSISIDLRWSHVPSMLMEQQLAAVERFSLIPGAPASQLASSERPTKSIRPPTDKGSVKAEAKKEPAKAEPPKPAPPKGPPIQAKEIDGTVLLVFPAERFDLDVAAALGKRDWDQVVRTTDNINGSLRDKIHREGASFIAPIEFLSEVFVDGKPLTKAAFEKDATTAEGMKSLGVHFPRFGEVTLLEIAGKGRFVTSYTSNPSRAAQLL